MVQEPGLLKILDNLVFELGVPAVRFEVARTLADLAETIDNRLVIALRCGKALVSLLRSSDDDDPRTIGHAVRCYANLSAFAGHTSDSQPPATTRYGATKHTEYGLDAEDAADAGRRFQGNDSEESDFGDSDEAEGADPKGGDTDGRTDAPLRDENEGTAVELDAEAPQSSEDEDEDEDEGMENVDFYWNTSPGVAMARNFNLHCLPQILEQIVSCGALGQILSATERQQALHAKKKGDKGDNDSAEDPDVRKYVIHIVRQLTLDLQNLTAHGTDWTEDSKHHAETHLNTCPECVGLRSRFTLP
jgi:hypothetical protein